MADFDTRNLAKKSGGTIKMVMTEECLDDWEAQTLNIPFEKLVRHKKTLRNVSVICLFQFSLRKLKDRRIKSRDQSLCNPQYPNLRTRDQARDKRVRKMLKNLNPLINQVGISSSRIIM